MLDTQRFQSKSAMLIELEQRTESAVRSRVSAESNNIPLGNCWNFFDENRFAGNRGRNR